MLGHLGTMAYAKAITSVYQWVDRLHTDPSYSTMTRSAWDVSPLARRHPRTHRCRQQDLGSRIPQFGSRLRCCVYPDRPSHCHKDTLHAHNMRAHRERQPTTVIHMVSVEHAVVEEKVQVRTLEKIWKDKKSRVVQGLKGVCGSEDCRCEVRAETV